MAAVLDELRMSAAEAEALVRRLLAAGLLLASGQSALPVAAAQPIEGRAMFMRRELVELRPWLPTVDRALGWLFWPVGAALWVLLGVVAMVLFVADDGRSDIMAWISQFDAQQALVLYVTFLALKLLHELGHATALWAMAAREGLPIQSVRAGVAIMLVIPFPFTNVSTAWRLQSKWRRAIVGMAGMYLESWVAIIALLCWAATDDPLVGSAAIQVATVAAVTTLLFNLNPFGRMDGYYVAADLLERPNLMQRASAAALTVPARLFRVRPPDELPRLSPALLAYWLGMLAYRLMVFTGLVWLAHKLSPWASLLMVAVALSLLVVRPALATGKRLVAMAAAPETVRRRLRVFALAVLAVVLLPPLPAGISAPGIIEARGARFIYPPRDVRIVSVSPTGNHDGGPALLLESPELIEAQRNASIRGAEAMARWRRAIDLGEVGAQAAAEAAVSQQTIAAALGREAAMLEVPAAAGWDPLDAAEYAGSWVAPNPRMPLSVVLPARGWRIHAVIAEREADRIRAGGDMARVRIAGRPEQSFHARIERVADNATRQLPSPALGRPAGGPLTVDPADPGGRRATAPLVSVWLVPQPDAPALRHGQRAEIRMGAPARPLAWQAAEAAMRLLDWQAQR